MIYKNAVLNFGFCIYEIEVKMILIRQLMPCRKEICSGNGRGFRARLETSKIRLN